MSKKQLNEVRRFMKLANLNGNITSNFIKETYGADYMREEEEIEDVSVEEEPDMGALEDEVMGLEDEEGAIEDEIGGLEAEGGADAEELVLSIVNDIQQLASLAGVDVDVEGDEAVEDEMDMDMDLDMEMGPDDEMDIEGDIELDTEAPEEETLAEMINSILQEDEEGILDDGEKILDDEELDDEELEETKRGQRRKTARPAFKKNESRKRKAKVRQESRKRRAKPRKESIEVVDDDKLIQEVAKRVKQRLVKIARAQKRRRK